MDRPRALLDRQLVFFGGKGGVGKTTLAAALAVRAADHGEKTLLVSTDPAHSTSDILETELGPEPRPVIANCWAMELDPESEVEIYIAGVRRRIGDTVAPRLLQEVERQIDAARVSPGAEEAALFERFTRIMDEGVVEFDRILFDTAPTAQTLRLLSLPELMTAWITGLVSHRKKANVLGRMWRNVAGAAAGSAPGDDDPVLAALEERRARFQRARLTLIDARRTAFAFVLVPERLPMRETERAVATLDKYGIPVAAVFVNRTVPHDAEGDFLERRRSREAGYLKQIEATFSDYPLLTVPLQEQDVVGVESLRRMLDSSS
jgi:arsenite-transporting ATPase